MAYPFATSGALGVNVTQVDSPASTLYPYEPDAQFALGQQITASDGSVWTYCILGTGGCTGAGYVLTFDEDFLAVMLSTSNDVYGMKVGVPAAAGSEDDYLWVQVYGTCQAIRVEQDALSDSALAPTGDAGQLDDAGASGLFVQGLVITTTNGGTDAVQPGVLNYPVIDTIPEAGT